MFALSTARQLFRHTQKSFVYDLPLQIEDYNDSLIKIYVASIWPRKGKLFLRKGKLFVQMEN